MRPPYAGLDRLTPVLFIPKWAPPLTFFQLPARQKTVFQACLLPNEQNIEPYKHYSDRFNIRQTPYSASS